MVKEMCYQDMARPSLVPYSSRLSSFRLGFPDHPDDRRAVCSLQEQALPEAQRHQAEKIRRGIDIEMETMTEKQRSAIRQCKFCGISLYEVPKETRGNLQNFCSTDHRDAYRGDRENLRKRRSRKMKGSKSHRKYRSEVVRNLTRASRIDLSEGVNTNIATTPISGAKCSRNSLISRSGQDPVFEVTDLQKGVLEGESEKCRVSGHEWRAKGTSITCIRCGGTANNFSASRHRERRSYYETAEAQCSNPLHREEGQPCLSFLKPDSPYWQICSSCNLGNGILSYMDRMKHKDADPYASYGGKDWYDFVKDRCCNFQFKEKGQSCITLAEPYVTFFKPCSRCDLGLKLMEADTLKKLKDHQRDERRRSKRSVTIHAMRPEDAEELEEVCA